MVTGKIFQLCDSITEAEALKLDPDRYIGQRKMDGDRILGIVSAKGEVLLMNRRSIDKSQNFSEVTEALKKLPADTIVDGEVISFDDDFNKLTRRSHTQDKFKQEILKKEIPVKFVIFDILKDKGEITMNLPYYQRLERLQKLFGGLQEVSVNLELVKTLPIAEALKEAHKNDSEGIIVKDINSIYESKRSKTWLKCKRFLENKMVMTKYTINNAGIRLEDNQGNAVQCSGSQSKEVKDLLDANHEVEIFVQYLELTKDGRMRMPSFRGLVKEDRKTEITFQQLEYPSEVEEQDKAKYYEKKYNG